MKENEEVKGRFFFHEMVSAIISSDIKVKRD